MPKMYSLYSLASMLPRKASQAVISRFSRRERVSLATEMVDDGIKLPERSRINENGIQRCHFTGI